MEEIIELLDANKKKLLLCGILLEVLVLILCFYTSEGQLLILLRHAARISARISLLFFVFVVFIFTSKSYSTYENRYLFTRNFAIVHFIHWLLLMSAMISNNFEFEYLRIIPGILSYITLLLTPFIYARNVLAYRWIFIWERWYLFIVWLLFFLTYLMRLTGNSPNTTGGFVSFIMGMFFVILIFIYYLIHYRNHSA